MKIFLAGNNGKKRIIRKIVNETILSGGGEPTLAQLPTDKWRRRNATVSGR
jgi:hypothetical protein